jgi:hypothetical protein
VKNRISRFDPECKPEVREREDPSIQGDSPNHIIRESWHFDAFRDNFPYCVVLAICHSSPAGLACVARAFTLPKLASSDTDYCLLAVPNCLLGIAYCRLFPHLASFRKIRFSPRQMVRSAHFE